MQRSALPLVWLICLPLTLTACSIGPKYQRPTALVSAAYKELPPTNFKELEGWKVAQPNDDISRGQWWTIFQDPQLNALEEQVDVSNQTLAVAEAQLRSARAAIGVARAALFPTVTAGASVSGERQSQNRPGVQNPSSATRADYQLPVNWLRVLGTAERS
jgi:outer membrane protein TolC